jgi:hypothetical protein
MLSVRGACDAFSFHRHLSDIAPTPGQSTLDLSRMTFATPFGLVGICVTARHASQRGKPVVLVRPTDKNVANYLARARLGPILDRLGVTHDLPSVRESDTRGNLLELSEFSSSSEVEALAVRVYDTAVVEAPSVAMELFRCLSETGDNVGLHSGQPSGYLVAQKFENSNELRFAVGDAGVGFLGSLAARGATNDEEALSLGLAAGISATDDNGRGYGLRQMADSLRAMRGSIAIASGNALRSEGSGDPVHYVRTAGFQGSLIEGRLPLAQA